MSNNGELNVTPGAPPVALARIDRIQTFEVQEMELDRLDVLVADENKALGFTTFSAGVLITALTSYLTAAAALSARATAIFIAVMLVSLVFTMWFGLTWRAASKERPRLLDKIRARCAPALPPAQAGRLLEGRGSQG